MKNKFILASASPRRKELLSYLGIEFDIVPSGIEEVTDYTKPSDIVKDLAFIKAKDISDKTKDKDTVVIGADTIVEFEGNILGKPSDIEDARKILLSLSGKTHNVLTGVCIILNGRVHKFYEQTRVTFDHISQDILEIYLNTGESLDKAGAYGIQGAALPFISKVEGCYSNVVGLPLNKLYHEMKNFL
ncbi:MAG: Maf family protein [Bacteriovoracaceae bacterium]|jgi:septum formation protein|nr:Maf family protein [Bacteriovoracaceae bacterium]